MIGTCYRCHRKRDDVETRYDHAALFLCEACYRTETHTPPVALTPTTELRVVALTPAPLSGGCVSASVSATDPDTPRVCARVGPDRLQSEDLLARHDVVPLPVTFDVEVPGGATVAAADFVARLFGLQHAVGESWPLIIGCEWLSEQIGCSKRAAAYALRTLVDTGALARRHDLPNKKGYGLRTYVLGPHAHLDDDASDGTPAVVQGDAVTVECAVAAVEPAVESPHEVGVGEAVAVSSGRPLDGMTTFRDGTYPSGGGHSNIIPVPAMNEDEPTLDKWGLK